MEPPVAEGAPKWLATVRERPELVVGPAWVVWLVLQSLPLVNGAPFLVSLLQTAELRGNAGQAFPLTYGAAVALFIFALYALRGLHPARRLLVAAAFPFAFTHLYEIPYDLVGRIVWPEYYMWATWPVVLLLNSSWLALGLSTAIFWRTRLDGLLLAAATIALFLGWWLFFWPPIGAAQPPLNPDGSGYILSKLFLAGTLALFLWNGRPAAALGPRSERPGLPLSSGEIEPASSR